MFTFADAQVAEFDRHQRMARAARARLVKDAAPAGYRMLPLAGLRAYARYALAALASVVFGMSTN